ncbi:MAG: acetate kinase, partial [Dysgonamonadaceae bacterium]|nr:acetate kinase [Dysgonamonadaceae bacterium]
KNKTIRSEEAVISAPESRVNVVVIPTDEEFMIAKDTENILKK